MNAAASPKSQGAESKTPLEDYISTNLESIKSGMGVYNGERITLDTELVRYHTCYSFVVLFMSRTSPYFVKGSSDAIKAASIAIVASSLVGWWSIHGLIYTPITLFRNVFHTDKTTIRQMIERAEAPPKKLHPAMRIMAVLFLVLVFSLFVWAGMNGNSGKH